MLCYTDIYKVWSLFLNKKKHYYFMLNFYNTYLLMNHYNHYFQPLNILNVYYFSGVSFPNQVNKYILFYLEMLHNIRIFLSYYCGSANTNHPHFLLSQNPCIHHILLFVAPLFSMELSTWTFYFSRFSFFKTVIFL